MGIEKQSRIFVAGHRGLVGSAIVRRLRFEGYDRLIVRTRRELDLTRQESVEQFFEAQKPEYVFLAAGRVGGILENANHPAQIIRENLLIQTNVIDAARRSGVKKLVLLGSSRIYPATAPQPLKEESLLTGPPDPTYGAYAAAKLAGVQMAQAYRLEHDFNAICVQPPSVFGTHANFDFESAYVVPALIRRFHEAKVSGADAVTVWGTGTPRREFLHADNCADACVFLMKYCETFDIVNVGTGEDRTILELAQQIQRIVGFEGEIVLDPSKPDGASRKVLDVSRIRRLGWTPKMTFERGLEITYAWFLDNAETALRPRPEREPNTPRDVDDF